MNLMKHLFFACLFYFSTSIYAQESCNRFVFADFDDALIEYWDKITADGQKENAAAPLNDLKDEWQCTKNEIDIACTAKESIELFIFIVNSNIASLDTFYSNKSEIMGVFQCIEIQNAFQKIRVEEFQYSYALDKLWDTYENYEQLNIIVHDQMLDLNTWKEFQHLVNEIEVNFKEYAKLCIEQKKTNFDFLVHENTVKNFNDCLSKFKLSTQQGYQPDIEMPCDELGHAIKQIMRLHL